VVIYTYWCDVETYGLSLFKGCSKSNIKLVSRAHRFDLYEENRKHRFIPFRKEVISLLDCLFSISNDGKQYLINRYHQKNIEVSFLGVMGDYQFEIAKENAVVRIVSCSFIHRVKRIELIKGSLLELAKTRPDQKFEWIHIGGDVSILNKGFLINIPTNLQIQFLGNLKNAEVHHYYQSNFISAFVNLSTSEGIPVSIMEAMSYAIPVVATNVGGVSEIVDETNGRLLSMDPEPNEVAKAIWYVIDNPELRSGARKTYETKFDGVLNYQDFADRLLTIGRNSNG
jgi:glycosyltransferase involved in cell wall biosynthesis